MFSGNLGWLWNGAKQSVTTGKIEVLLAFWAKNDFRNHSNCQATPILVLVKDLNFMNLLSAVVILKEVTPKMHNPYPQETMDIQSECIGLLVPWYT